MVSKHQAGEFWALKNALEIRNKIFIKKLNYKINKIILTKCEQLFIMLLEMMKMIYNYNKLVIKRNNSKLTASENKFIKEHEEHVKCLKRITESVFMIQKKLNIKRSGVSDNIRKGN